MAVNDSLTDVRFQALRALGYTGTVSDMLLPWLQSEGATANNIPDAWREMLIGHLPSQAGAYQRSDWWYAYLGSLGFTGNMNDRELAYWVNVDPTPIPGPPDDFGDGFGPGFS